VVPQATAIVSGKISLFIIRLPVTGDDNIAQKPKAEKVPRAAEKPHGENKKNVHPNYFTERLKGDVEGG